MKKMGRVLLVSTGILVGTSSISCPNIGLETSKASAAIVNIKTKYQTTANLYLRQGAGTTYKSLVIIPKGKVITATQRNGNWYKVTYSSKTGWVSGTYLKEYYKYTTQATAYYFTNKTTKLYPTPDTKKAAVYSVVVNNGFYSTQNIVNSIDQTWLRVSYNGKTLYVNSADVTKSAVATFAQTKYKAIKNTSLYQTYGASSKVLSSIPSGTVISSSKRVGNWYSVTLNGKTGYVYINNFTKVNEVKYETTSTAYYFTKAVTNLYATPDATKPVVTTVNGDNGFASTQKATDLVGKIWYRINYNGKNLYVKSEDVSANSFTTFTTTKYKALNATYLYESFGNASKQLIQIPKDTVIPISKKIGNWYSVSYNGVNGYVRTADFGKSDVVTITNITDTTYITTSELNLRQTYDTSSALLTVIPVNMVLMATDKTSNNWYKVSYNGKTGYVSGSYIKQVKTGDPITSRDSYQFIDLRTPSPVTAAQINTYIANNVKSGVKSILTGQGQLFIDAGNKYGVNALYLAAHAIHESGFGTSQISLGKNNLFGFGSYDTTPYIASYKFMSVQENVEYIARSIKSTYLNPSNWKYKGAYLGFSTKDMSNVRIDAASEGMNFYYATDPNWGKLIAQHMQKILPFNKAYYDQAQPNTTIPGSPSTPVGSDVFPANVQAVAKGNIDLYTAKGDTAKVKSITAGTTFLLLEKTNNYWIKLSIDGNVFWTNSIKLNAYSQTLSVKNLGRITTDGLNVRSAATTAENNVIGKLNLNNYVSIVTNTDGTLTMDSTKKWYEIQLANGSFGWVSSSYVKQELK
ncbi:peptide-binding protein [Bacillus sp. AFS077874]|uniref:SH3 domain-containing protein n=1 Tax=unclassified Bacillus (in: firmicutes) TaxID=185979 RepID=UPI000BEDE55D|nr:MULTISPECIES: SH3 domain-containing protein [unclassified Bacillus (in: firmicutes)]PEC50537.1 peptide-binding protein [Bacillus sp. AFS096315]PFM81930.1 peptide-binding protein [Bacillus sp. AFS077874]